MCTLIGVRLSTLLDFVWHQRAVFTSVNLRKCRQTVLGLMNVPVLFWLSIRLLRLVTSFSGRSCQLAVISSAPL
jgi:putative flippase GtrA